MNVLVGLPAVHYILPIALVSFHSLFFRKEISRLREISSSINDTSNNVVVDAANKKRKLGPENETNDTHKADSESMTKVEAVKENPTSIRKTKPEELVIRPPDVDPSIFSLFLKYIYQGYYPTSVDTLYISPYTADTNISTLRTPHQLRPYPHSNPPPSPRRSKLGCSPNA